MHDVGGDIYGYTSLAGELSGRVDLFGIKLAHEQFLAPQEISIIDLASEYVAQLERMFDESQPFVIVGWSLGGLVAFEMAKLFDRRPHSVARLVLVDAPYELDLPAPDNAAHGVFLPEHERALLDQFRWLGDGAPLFSDGASVEDMWRAVRARLDAPTKERLAAELQQRYPLMARVIPHLSSLSPLEFVGYINRFRSVFQAGYSYRVSEATAAPIDFLAASRSQNFDPRWSTRTSGNFRHRCLEGDHFSILERRSIRATAQVILAHQ